MASSVNIFERYGIKEVANVSFYALAADEVNGFEEGDIVLYLDTLKVSTIENTAENVSAQGGWGNPKLVTWDYGKDINVTLEDAVVSWEELRIILGGQFRNSGLDAEGNEVTVTVHKTAERTFKNGDIIEAREPDAKYAGKVVDGKHYLPAEALEEFHWVDMTRGFRGNQNDEMFGTEFTATDDEKTRKIRFFWTEEVKEEGAASEIIISPNTFPGTYKVVGDTLIRSEKTGKDEAFQFIINKAKMLSEVTLTMQAEGDPSTFNMTLNVLRDNDGNMFSLVKYA